MLAQQLVLSELKDKDAIRLHAQRTRERGIELRHSVVLLAGHHTDHFCAVV